MTVLFNSIVNNYKKKIADRLNNNQKNDFTPVISSKTLKYELSDKISAIHCGGIGCMGKNQNSAILRTSWIILTNQKSPRLTTCYIM